MEKAPYLGDGAFGEPVFRTCFFLELQGTPGGTRRYELDREAVALRYIDGGAVLLAALTDGTVRAWSVATGDHEVFLRLREYCDALFTSPDGELLFARGTGGLPVWHLATRQRRAVLAVPYDRADRPPALVFSPDRSVLVTLSGGTAQAWDTTTWEMLATLGRRPQAVAVALSPDASLIAAGYSDGTARIWDTAVGRQVRVLGDHEGQVASVAFSPGGAFLATAAGSVRTWDAANWAPRGMELGPSGFVSVAFSPDGTSLAGRGPGDSALVWDPATGTCKFLLPQEMRQALAYAPGGTLLAAGYDRRHGVVLRVADAAVPSRRVLLVEKDCHCTMAAISPDGRLIVTWSTWFPSQAPRAWRLPRRLPRAFPGRRRKRVPFARLAADGVACVAFSADSSLIFTGMADGTVRTWDAATGVALPVPALTGHDGRVAAVAASADGSTIATASGDTEASRGDGTVRVWDARAGQAVATLGALPGGGAAAWFPDGSYRVDDRAAGLWWAIKLCRFEPGELDPYLPAPRRRGEAETSSPAP